MSAMRKGYRTDAEGHVLDYWELPFVPADTSEFKFVESDSRPEIYVSPSEQKKRSLKAIDALLDAIDLKSIRGLRAGDTSYLRTLENQAVTLRTERKKYE